MMQPVDDLCLVSPEELRTTYLPSYNIDLENALFSISAKLKMAARNGETNASINLQYLINEKYPLMHKDIKAILEDQGFKILERKNTLGGIGTELFISW